MTQNVFHKYAKGQRVRVIRGAYAGMYGTVVDTGNVTLVYVVKIDGKQNVKFIEEPDLVEAN